MIKISTYRAVHILILSVMVLAFSALPCHAADRARKAPVSTGKKKLLLFAKNPATWKIVRGRGNGKMVYHAASGAFTLNASGLRSGTAYTLVRYADEAPKVELLAGGESDRQGRLRLAGTWRDWTKKFWLVTTKDVQGTAGMAGTLTAWHPERYLFEEKPLGISCDCPEPDEP